MTNVLLSLGSNTDNPQAQLAVALGHLRNLPDTQVTAQSSVFTTAPWGKTDQPDFLNMAVTLSTAIDVVQLMSYIVDIEHKMGRERIEKWGPRKIDIDIILFGNEVSTHEKVIVPHPHMHERRFVLQPSAEIAGNMIHPVLNKTIAELLIACPDSTVAAPLLTE
ncbi:MAG TPA: 2-amino-4-hydroxy-6-hydroxymethyldihydropteridine diphosphokinase [Bacteroidia bacterium]|nr:2-amino-4-hydroxy-6-hydroxymethyldihydropteridine diphosphokinase [Bacteroidia bacterium]